MIHPGIKKLALSREGLRCNATERRSQSHFTKDTLKGIKGLVVELGCDGSQITIILRRKNDVSHIWTFDTLPNCDL